MTWPTEGPKEWNDQELVTAALLNQELQGPLNYLHDEHPPKRAVMWHMNSIVTVGGLISLYVETGQPFNHYAQQQPRANGDEFTQSFYLRAGTYTFKVLGMTGNYNGIIDWYLDGDQQENLIASGQDWYQGGPNANVIKKVDDVAIDQGGVHYLIGKVNGKNASSNDYKMQLTALWFEPSSDS